MKNQPNRDYNSNDVVMTPKSLAYEIDKHFNPIGKILEPCCGDGVFIDVIHERQTGIHVDWCEINKGRDFFDYDEKVDWIITNPPWSKIRPFLQHSMEVADNIVFLVTVNHLWTKARIRDIREAGFGIKEIMLIDMPKEFPQSGFQLGAIHLQRDWKGDIKLHDVNVAKGEQDE